MNCIKLFTKLNLQLLIILAVCFSPCFSQQEELPKVRPPHPPTVSTGKAIKLVTPPFPDCNCKFYKVNKLIIHFVVDEKGNVESADVADGHPALKNGSLAAIRNSKFSISFVGNEPVKAFGVVTYDFGWKNNKKRVRVLSIELKLKNPE